jgi:ribonuclease VapC
MVIDTSALIAILLNEPERDEFIDAVASDAVRLISAVNALETALVIEARRGESGGLELDLLMHRAQIDTVPFTKEHVEEARRAWRQFGKGNHPAGLNFCDCCAHALSKVAGEPLLFKGGDFSRTDVSPAVAAKRGRATVVFHLVLQDTYHRQGFFNVPVAFERYFGPHNSEIEIYIEAEREAIHGIINRTAQRNGAPRIHGHGALRRYFQSRLVAGDAFTVQVESPRRIRLHPGKVRG